MNKQDLVSILLPITLVACLGDDEPEAHPSVFFVSPTNGSTVSTELVVRFGATDFAVKPAGEVEPGSGYLNLFIGAPCGAEGERIVPSASVIALSGGQTAVALELAPGHYTLCVRASDGAGIALPLGQSIEIDVVEEGVTIVSPTEGAAIGTEVSIELRASGIVIEPKSAGVSAGHGHFYVAMETDCPPEGASVAQETSVLNLRDGESSVTIIVDRGPHSLCVGVADGDDLALAARAKVSFHSY